jgi:predicted site-specific integrase-resolvase
MPRPTSRPACDAGADASGVDERGFIVADRDDESTPVGYARVSTEHQDLTAQRNSLAALGVGDDRIYVDHGLTGTNRDRPGLRHWLPATAATPWS